MNNISLLLIEDDAEDAALFESLTASLRDPIVNLVVAEELQEGLEKLDLQKFDLVISDLNLPDASGVDTVRRLAEKVDKTPILVLTGSEEDQLLDGAAHLGVYDYLYKADLNQRYIKRSIRYALSKHRMTVENSLLQSQLYQSQKMEAVGQLTGGIAHDFNNKLSIISGNVELLARNFRYEENTWVKFEAVRSAIQQSAKLTSQLLAFSRKQEIQKSVVDLNAIARGSTKLLERVMTEKTELSFVPEENLYMTNVDPIQVDQILMNLVINARDAMDGCGKISVSTKNISIGPSQILPNGPFKEVGDYVCLEVSDTGPGIPEEIQSQIFDPFFTTKEVGKGTGLGLSVVHGIVTQHDGVLQVKNRPELGACFEIYFKRAEEGVLDQVSPLAVVGFPTSQTVLYVEDEPELRVLISDALKAHGLMVIEAENGLEALELYKQNKEAIDLVITDVVMPKMTGTELFKKLREFSPGLPFIFTSGYSKQEVAPDGTLPELTQFIGKPCSYDQLISETSKFLQLSPEKRKRVG